MMVPHVMSLMSFINQLWMKLILMMIQRLATVLKQRLVTVVKQRLVTVVKQRLVIVVKQRLVTGYSVPRYRTTQYLIGPASRKPEAAVPPEP